jgi:hypothetical protein
MLKPAKSILLPRERFITDTLLGPWRRPLVGMAADNCDEGSLSFVSDPP